MSINTVAYRLYLGRRKFGFSESLVSDIELASYLRAVSTVFEGFSVFPTLGYWQSKSEPAVCLEILASDTSENDASIEAIAREYCIRFSQDSVLTTKLQSSGLNFVSATKEVAA